MRSLIQSTGLALLVMLPFTANAGIMELSGDGGYSEAVDSSNGWVTEDTFTGDNVDFWTFEISEPTTLSVDIESDIAFGISVYMGQIADEFATMFFSNSGDFTDGSLTYAGGTPAIPGGNSSLSSLFLDSAGFFTIAVGGAEGFDLSGPFNYTMNVATAAAVPEPSTLALMLAGGLTLVARRRSAKNA
ncbi:PEP-CTERM sorting domain-containing protein [Marinobacter fonticola]|uniref:PEP-CTERM sorting domain-containing protein n=1 Tax=Marinobacter fonticola TaxID=2603215 RepID=UPI00143CDABF|nr:PEP-CTERM sorting domain-containing protein [Marinobacter fonticola]